MKKFILMSFVLSGLLFTETGCKKDDSSDSDKSTTTPTPAANTGVMTAKINGVAWSAKTLVNTLIRVEDQGRRLDLRGTDAGGKQIIVTIADEEFVSTVMKKGTYTFDNDDALFTYLVNNNSEHIEIEGTTVITSVDATAKTVSGTFNFTAFKPGSNDTLKVTNGVFVNMSYLIY